MTEIRSLESGDLQVQLDKLKRDLFNLRVKVATESIENPARIGQLRKDIARLLTERRRREMAARSGS
jgi:large subunit ribosomal protein L29